MWRNVSKWFVLTNVFSEHHISFRMLSGKVLVINADLPEYLHFRDQVKRTCNYTYG